MLALFGLLLSGLGIGYAVHKDNQKFANMRANAIKLNGRMDFDNFDDTAVTNKYFWELKNYFDERYDYYISHKDFIINETNFKRVNRPDITKEQLLQHFAGSLAYDDMFAKYAPDYEQCHDEVYGTSCESKTDCAFSEIARALTRKEAYRLGFLPSHMQNMSCKLNGKALYFYNGVGNICRLGSTDWDKVQWDKEPFKYNCHGFMLIGMPNCERKQK